MGIFLNAFLWIFQSNYFPSLPVMLDFTPNNEQLHFLKNQLKSVIKCYLYRNSAGIGCYHQILLPSYFNSTLSGEIAHSTVYHHSHLSPTSNMNLFELAPCQWCFLLDSHRYKLMINYCMIAQKPNNLYHFSPLTVPSFVTIRQMIKL